MKYFISKFFSPRFSNLEPLFFEYQLEGRYFTWALMYAGSDALLTDQR